MSVLNTYIALYLWRTSCLFIFSFSKTNCYALAWLSAGSSWSPNPSPNPHQVL